MVRIPSGRPGLAAHIVSDTSSSLSLLKDRLFRRLWAGVELSLLGGFIHVVACGWLMTGLAVSATMVALIQTAYALPLVLFSTIAGALADTFDRRRTMLISLVLSLAASVGLVTTAWAGALTPWLMLGLVFAVGTGLAIFTPSWQASLGDIAPRSRLSDAVSLHNVGTNVMRTVGPALGGFLIGSVGATLTFAVGALSYLPACLALLLWRPSNQKVPVGREPLTSAMGSAVRYLAASRALIPILIRAFAFSLSAIAVMALLPLIARNQLGGNARTYGLLLGGFGLGAIVGGLRLAHLRRRFSPETLGGGAFLMNAAAIAVLALADNFWLALAATVAGGSCWLVVHTIHNSTLQLVTPRWIVGRMVAMFLTSAYLGLSIGGWLWGRLAEWGGTRYALAAAAAGMFGTWLLALRYRLPDAEALALDPLEDAGGRVALPPLAPHTGPLVLTFEHHIEPAKADEFRHLMAMRRQHVTRLGGRQWTLARDVRDAECWIESFRIRNWTDYQRYMSRRTTETVALRDAIRQIQRGEVDPGMRVLVVNPDTQPAPVAALPT